MSTLETGLARGPLYLLDSAAEMGVERAALMAAGGLSEADLRDPDSRILIAVFVELWRELLRHRPDQDLGLTFGMAMQARDLGLLGYLMLFSRDLELALRRLVRFARILGESNKASFVLQGDAGTLRWQPDPRLQAIPQSNDWILSALLHISRELTDTAIRPVKVHLPYETQTPRKSLRDTFGAPVQMGSKAPALVFRASDLRRPVVAADSTLGGYLEQHAASVLETLPLQFSFCRRARSAIWRLLREGEPTLERLAEDLEMSPRTVQRRLAEEGTSFSELLEELRRTLALSLLRERDLGIHEVAFLLGYSEPSAFNRAFRRWRQTSPSAFRAEAHAAN